MIMIIMSCADCKALLFRAGGYLGNFFLAQLAFVGR